MGNGDKKPPGEKVPAIAQSGTYDQAFFLALAAKGKEEWNAWREKRANKGVHVTFAGIDFPKAIDFSGFSFGDHADFSGATFMDAATFVLANFRNDANFRGTRFRGAANFANANFEERAHFDATVFEGDAAFNGSSRFLTFSARAFLWRIQFRPAHLRARR